MKLALLGLGRMGRAVAALATPRGHEVVLTLDSKTNPEGTALTPTALSGVDVAIDFTTPDAVLPNVARCAAAGVPCAVGTTGWYDRLEQLRGTVEEHGTGVVYGANFSIGANLFMSISAHAAKLFSRFAEYDPYVSEHHHVAKRDAPSGTGLRLAEAVVAANPRKTRVQTGAPAGAIAPEALHVVSLRAGAAFGRHEVGFDSPVDNVTLSHVAHGRDGFASGALHAAEWIRDKKGLFEFSSILGGDAEA